MTCEELEQERVTLQDGRDAAQNLVNYFDTALMYNWWNRYLQGCIPGMTGNEMEKPAAVMSRAEFDAMLKAKPIMKELIELYMSEDQS